MDIVGDIMVRTVITAKPSDSLLHIRKLMIRHRINRVVVIGEESKPIGMITQKDLLGFIASDATFRGIDEIPVSEAMSRKPITIHHSIPVSDAAEAMMKKGISSLIVVDRRGILVGIVTKSDLCRYYSCKRVSHKVKDFMTPNPVKIRPSHSIFSIISLIIEHKISRVVVVDDGEPIGIVTMADLTRVSPMLKPKIHITRRGHLFPSGIASPSTHIALLTAGDIMTSDPISIYEEAYLTDAAMLMIRHGISGLPVIDSGGKLVGIVTKTDITRATTMIRDEKASKTTSET